MKESWKIHLDEIIIKIELHLDKFIIIVSNNDVPLNLVRMNITCSNLTLDLSPVLFSEGENFKKIDKED